MRNSRLSMHTCIAMCLSLSALIRSGQRPRRRCRWSPSRPLRSSVHRSRSRCALTASSRHRRRISRRSTCLTSHAITQLRVQSGQRVTRGDPLFVVQADPAAALAATQARSAATLADGEARAHAVAVRQRSCHPIATRYCAQGGAGCTRSAGIAGTERDYAAAARSSLRLSTAWCCRYRPDKATRCRRARPIVQLAGADRRPRRPRQRHARRGALGRRHHPCRR